MSFKKTLDYELSNCKINGIRFKKLKFKDIIDILGYGLQYKIYYCASNQNPENGNYFRTYNYNNRPIEDFRKWHKKIKEKICNDKDGSTLKYYIDVDELEDIPILRKIMLFNYDFEPNEELNNIVKEYGHPYLWDIHARMDERIIKLIENELDEFGEYHR